MDWLSNSTWSPLQLTTFTYFTVWSLAERQCPQGAERFREQAWRAIDFRGKPFETHLKESFCSSLLLSLQSNVLYTFYIFTSQKWKSLEHRITWILNLTRDHDLLTGNSIVHYGGGKESPARGLIHRRLQKHEVLSCVACHWWAPLLSKPSGFPQPRSFNFVHLREFPSALTSHHPSLTYV